MLGNLYGFLKTRIDISSLSIRDGIWGSIGIHVWGLKLNWLDFEARVGARVADLPVSVCRCGRGSLSPMNEDQWRTIIIRSNNDIMDIILDIIMGDV